MIINKKYRKLFENAIVRIKVEMIDLNWDMPYQLGQISAGHGSGFFIDSQHIITCAHVIDSSKNIYIEIPSQGSKKIEVECMGFCPRFDIALLKTKDYKSKYHLKLGSVKNVHLGDEIYVIGYPVSMTQQGISEDYNIKYTKGIISGTQLSLIQVTANINPGVSGSCLIHQGKVIGINSQKLVGEQIEGVGYSVPIDFYKVIEKEFDFKSKNKETILIRRPSLAFEYSNTNKSLMEYSKIQNIEDGVYVSKIYKNSPLEQIKIKEGDIITKINKLTIDNFGMVDFDWLQTKQDLYTYMNQFKLGDKIEIEFYRSGKRYNKKIELKPYVAKIRIKYPLFEKVDYEIIGGMIFMNLSLNHIKENPEKYIKYLNPDEQQESKLICSFIFPNTPMFILNNINKGDIIKKINGQKVSNLKEFRKALEKPIKSNKIEYLELENEDNKIAMLDLNKSLIQDMVFSDIYKFNLSSYHEKKMKKFSKKNIEKNIKLVLSSMKENNNN